MATPPSNNEKGGSRELNQSSVVGYIMSQLPPEQKAAATLIADLYGQTRELQGRLTAIEGSITNRIAANEKRLDVLESGSPIKVARINAAAVTVAAAAGAAGGVVAKLLGG